MRAGRVGPYQLQAAIAAVHSEAQSADQTDWRQIVALYDLLAGSTPSAVVALNRAAAVAMAEGPEVGLALMDAPDLAQALREYRWYHAARADLLRRLARPEEAAAAYRRALQMAANYGERAYLQRRLTEVTSERANQR